MDRRRRRGGLGTASGLSIASSYSAWNASIISPSIPSLEFELLLEDMASRGVEMESGGDEVGCGMTETRWGYL
jgi:hypothetical protein